MYVVLLFLFSAVFYLLILRAHSIGAGGGIYVFGIMWCPGLAGILTLELNGRNLTELGWRWPSRRYAAVSWYVPLMYAAIAYVFIWTLSLGGFPNHEFMNSLVTRMGLRASPLVSTVIYVLLAGTFGVVRSLANALGEEIGWRGFLVPELSKTFSFTSTALISGVIWATWHYPCLIWADYNPGTPTWYGLTCFTVMVIAISFVFAWTRLKSGSLWTGALLHASHNLYIQGIFTPMTADTGKTAWFIDEFGAVLPVVVVVFAIYFWRKRHELPQPEGQLQAAAATDRS